MSATPHFRGVVRQAVVAALVAGGTLAAARVYDTPTDTRTRFPALTVEDLGEQQQVLSGRGTGATVRRTLTLEVTAEVQQVAAYAADRDQLLAEVETLLAAFTLAGVQNVQPMGYAPDLVPGAERPIAIGRQRFAFTYITTQGAPGVPVV